MNRRIEEIRERLAEATPGPWAPEADKYGQEYEGFVMAQGDGTTIVRPGVNNSNYRADARFIAAAPGDIAYLLEQVAILTIERDGASERAKMVLESKSAIIYKLTRELSEAREALKRQEGRFDRLTRIASDFVAAVQGFACDPDNAPPQA